MYSKTIQKIHKEYYEASDKLLAEANEIISGNNTEKAVRLEKVGFKKSREVESVAHVAMNMKIASTIEYYKNKYPNNKFITVDQVEQINNKYNLICGPIGVYKGFVPDVKLKQIESFKIDRIDIKPDQVKILKWSFTHTDEDNIKEFNKQYPDGIIPSNLFIGGSAAHYRHPVIGRMFVKSWEEMKTEMMICAPLKDMDVDGLKKVKSFFSRVTTREIPDPIVLQPVKDGFLIVAAWGDEASDPIVVNEINN
jgi:hypothetical protein